MPQIGLEGWAGFGRGRGKAVLGDPSFGVLDRGTVFSNPSDPLYIERMSSFEFLLIYQFTIFIDIDAYIPTTVRIAPNRGYSRN